MSKVIRTQGGVQIVSLPVKSHSKSSVQFPKPRIRQMKYGRHWVCHHNNETYGFGNTPGDAYRDWGEKYYERITKITGFPNHKVEGSPEIEVHPPFI